MTLMREVDGPAAGPVVRETAGGAVLWARRRGFAAYRLAQLLLLMMIAPNAIFAAALGAIPGVVLVIGCVSAAWLTLTWRPAAENSILASRIDWKVFGACVLTAFGLCLLGGETHVFYAMPDWLMRDSVLADLVRHGYPTAYTYDNRDYVLRAPLGMYAFPAVMGRFFGLLAAHVTLLAQNATALSIILYFLAKLFEVRLAVALPLFLLFSGADMIGVLLAEIYFVLRGWGLQEFSHIEFWNETISYSSNLTHLFWAPNHGLPGWWFAVLILLYVRGAASLELLVASFAAMLFWSPLAMLGAFTFLLYFGVEALVCGRLKRRDIAAAGVGLLFLPMAYWLTIDVGEVKQGFLIGREGFVWLYAAFLLVEIPHVWIVAARWSMVEARDRVPLLLGGAILVVLPLYSFGPGNDIAMRASIPALFLLAFAFVRIAARTPRDNSRFASAISAIVLLGVATPLIELKAAFNGAYGISDCNFLTAWRKASPGAWPSNYLARIEKTPSWLMQVPDSRLVVEQRRCWPDHPGLAEERK